jgi:hypothetical protein
MINISEFLIKLQTWSESKLFKAINEKRLKPEPLSEEEIAYFKHFRNTYRSEFASVLFVLPSMYFSIM